eukprot:s2397_g7.t1
MDGKMTGAMKMRPGGMSPNATYWNEDSADWRWEDAEYGSEWPADDEADMEPDENAEDPDEIQYQEAYALASEANRTLKEAREAVRKVRSARSYFSPEADSGKVMTSSSASRMTGKGIGGKSSSGKGKGITVPCFRCGMRGHLSADCPDRFSPGKGAGKGSFKGKSKGKGKGKSKFKGKNFYADVCTLTLMWNEDARARNSFTRIVVDTGASESAVGADSLAKLLYYYGKFQYDINMDDRPIFRFGNGLKMQAMSRVDIKNTALGAVSFHVLGGTASDAPPLLGSKVLFRQCAHISYANSMTIFEAGPRDSMEFGMFAVPIEILPTWPMTLDLKESAIMMDTPNYMVQSIPTFAAKDDVSESHVGHGEVFLPLFVMSATDQSRPPLRGWIQQLAQRLQQLKDRRLPDDGTMCSGRSPKGRVSMLVESCGQAAHQPVRDMVNLHEVRLRIDYAPKKGYAGETRHMGPAPHTIREVMESLERDFKAEDVNEKIVNGRLMEAQGRMLQMGVTNTMAIDMSYNDHLKRMGREKATSSNKMASPKTKEIKEAATKELIQQLETTAAGQAATEAVELHGSEVSVVQPSGQDGQQQDGSTGGWRCGKLGESLTGLRIPVRAPVEVMSPMDGAAGSVEERLTGLGPGDGGKAQRNGGGMESYEIAGEQYLNSKGLTTDLVGSSLDDGSTGHGAFERPGRESCHAVSRCLDEHGNQVSGT